MLEAEPGGRLRVGYPTGQVAGGRVVAVEADRRIVFTWGYEGDGQAVPAGSPTVEITLEPQTGGTRLELRGAPESCQGVVRFRWAAIGPGEAGPGHRDQRRRGRPGRAVPLGDRVLDPHPDRPEPPQRP